MSRVYRRAMVAVFIVPLAAEAWHYANKWFDAWFAAQLRKAWRPR